jgi:F-type H+/Na+-transporting ATPase subunit alpha
VVSVWAGLQGLMDEVPVDDVLRFEREMLDYLRHHSKSLQNIRETKNFDDDTGAALREQIAEFKKGFQTGEGKLLAGREEHEALGEEEVEQEKIVKQRRG